MGANVDKSLGVVQEEEEEEEELYLVKWRNVLASVTCCVRVDAWDAQSCDYRWECAPLRCQQFRPANGLDAAAMTATKIQNKRQRSSYPKISVQFQSITLSLNTLLL